MEQSPEHRAESILRYCMYWLLYATLRTKPLILSMSRHVWRTFSSVLSGRLCPYRSGGEWGHNLVEVPSGVAPIWGSLLVSKGGVKKRPLFGNPFWTPSVPLLGPLGEYSGPLGSQRGAKMIPKLVHKSEPLELLKTVLSLLRELT